MRGARTLLSLGFVPAVFALMSPAHAAITLTNTSNISLAHAQVEVGGDATENPDVTGGLAFGPTMLSYSATGSFPIEGLDAGKLNNGDVGPGNVSDGVYAIVDFESTIVLDLGAVHQVGSIAIYPGYRNRYNGSYTIRDGAGVVQGAFTLDYPGLATLQGPHGNEGITSFWLTFNTPLVTDRIQIDIAADPDEWTYEPSFREIQVFAVPEPASLALVGVGLSALLGRRFGRCRR